MARERGVDPECLRLARHFLEDYAAEDTLLADLLGERVQGAVEDWLEEWLSPEKPHLRLLQGVPRLFE